MLKLDFKRKLVIYEDHRFGASFLVSSKNLASQKGDFCSSLNVQLKAASKN